MNINTKIGIATNPYSDMDLPIYVVKPILEKVEYAVEDKLYGTLGLIDLWFEDSPHPATLDER